MDHLPLIEDQIDLQQVVSITNEQVSNAVSLEIDILAFPGSLNHSKRQVHIAEPSSLAQLLRLGRKLPFEEQLRYTKTETEPSSFLILSSDGDIGMKRFRNELIESRRVVRLSRRMRYRDGLFRKSFNEVPDVIREQPRFRD